MPAEGTRAMSAACWDCMGSLSEHLKTFVHGRCLSLCPLRLNPDVIQSRMTKRWPNLRERKAQTYGDHGPVAPANEVFRVLKGSIAYNRSGDRVYIRSRSSRGMGLGQKYRNRSRISSQRPRLVHLSQNHRAWAYCP